MASIIDICIDNSTMNNSAMDNSTMDNYIKDSSNNTDMGSGFIYDWEFNILEPSLTTCMNAIIYNSKHFSDGKYILTSKIVDVKLVTNFIGNNYIIVITSNNSKYILGACSNEFKEYINSEINDRNLDKTKHTFENHTGIVNIIKWYLATYSVVNV